MQWFRAYALPDDIVFYYEFSPEGWVTRKIELTGPEREVRAAASRSEWVQALREGRRHEYYREFGSTPDVPRHQWEEDDLEEVTESEFETLWDNARRTIIARRGHS